MTIWDHIYLSVHLVIAGLAGWKLEELAEVWNDRRKAKKQAAVDRDNQDSRTVSDWMQLRDKN